MAGAWGRRDLRAREDVPRLRLLFQLFMRPLDGRKTGSAKRTGRSRDAILLWVQMLGKSAGVIKLGLIGAGLFILALALTLNKLGKVG